MNDSTAAEQPLSTDTLGHVLWKRHDEPAFERCRVLRVADFYAVAGCVLTIADGEPLQVDYLVHCNLDWSTRAVHVHTLQGTVSRRLDVRRESSGGWLRDDEPLPHLQGLIDIDLSISPSTNTLPIRRLRLEVGAEAPTDAAWVKFPDLSIDRLPQKYRRVDSHRYVYESRGGSFRADIEVDDQGIVVRYGDIWERIAPPPK